MSTLAWQKSSYCAEGNSCLNLAVAPDRTIRLRESEDPDITLTTTPAHLGTFIRAAKAGAFDHLAP
ncbi:hypothetical protein SBI_03544 [Streptomyces bingchenggensis BCW-1]|uniref:DUF397 domain-containing protein n=1 Tax=Streptomyces bingchenggensis (strain BCW-1) TaxID=749414 RepID=D7CCE6_STRBB|nr:MULTISPECIES: DUF397 domain-containing protein [Streptomyces]ADI06665.1 hypothetical protein SBI_03544 [Streptomyces bingchenggensis BCW-1]